MIFIHKIRILPRVIALILLTQIGFWLLAAPSLIDIAIGTGLLILAILLVADMARWIVAWAKSYAGRG